ncbi:MAG: hypothetical protein DRO43_04120 [Candidatus Hecatellales archaeon]|nr:MAG: hypothetical protein DRO43_04120 [Candidatus Hecatellales archaeon]
MLFLGLDVGGANIKAALLKVKGRKPVRLEAASQYFPLWKAGREKLPKALRMVQFELEPKGEIAALALTMTAETSDVYQHRREGVVHVLRCVKKVWRGVPLEVVETGGRLIAPEEAERNPLKAASANWAASGWLVSRLLEEALLVDVGSTTTTVVPVSGGKIKAKGETDLEKLSLGELVYTGALRTSVASIVEKLKVKGRLTRVSSEYFASTSDVYLVLGEISPDDYTVETADGRGKTRMEALARLARTVCADLEMLGEKEASNIAYQVAVKQVSRIAEALNQVFQSHWRQGWKRRLPVVVAGVKGGFLAEKAARKAGFHNIIEVDELAGFKISRILPAAASAFMAADKAVGGVNLKG